MLRMSRIWADWCAVSSTGLFLGRAGFELFDLGLELGDILRKLGIGGHEHGAFIARPVALLLTGGKKLVGGRGLLSECQTRGSGKHNSSAQQHPHWQGFRSIREGRR